MISNIMLDQTKYTDTLTVLDQDSVGHLLDLLCAPPAESRYKAIKTCLTKTFGQKCWVRANRLLEMSNLEDRMPSVLMDEMFIEQFP